MHSVIVTFSTNLNLRSELLRYVIKNFIFASVRTIFGAYERKFLKTLMRSYMYTHITYFLVLFKCSCFTIKACIGMPTFVIVPIKARWENFSH